MMWESLLKRERLMPTESEINEAIENYESRPNMIDIVKATGDGYTMEGRGSGRLPFAWIGLKTLSPTMLKQSKDNFTMKQLKDNFNADEPYEFTYNTHPSHVGSAGKNKLREVVRDLAKFGLELANKNLQFMGKPKLVTFDFWEEEDRQAYYDAMGLEEEEEERTSVKITKDTSTERPPQPYKFNPPTKDDKIFYITLFTKHPAYKEIVKALKKLPEIPEGEE